MTKYTEKRIDRILRRARRDVMIAELEIECALRIKRCKQLLAEIWELRAKESRDASMERNYLNAML